MKLPHFGLHRVDAGLQILVQDSGVQHVLDLNLSIKAKVPQRYQCPHEIRLDQTEDAVLPKHPLIETMLPRHRRAGEPIQVLTNSPESKVAVQTLLRLSSSTVAPVPIWMLEQGPFAYRMLNLTNLQPLVVYSDKPEPAKFKRLIELAQYSPRRLVLLAPEMSVLNSATKAIRTPRVKALMAMNLEAIGAGYLRRLMKEI